ncbi:uncharacterized protein G2W53_033228 [Senna tora]|uniref:Uncharacterized protein n=1 Tax=Senna tora TaxID=362788 RepID=A0A834T1U5_9FABA|nr:uncharacterized protein G2W53_033228 [Senna tora]
MESVLSTYHHHCRSGSLNLRFCSAFVDSSPPGKHFGKGED